MTNKLPSAAINATGAPSGRTTTPSSVRPAFVLPSRDQTDSASFQIELAYLLGSIATGVLFAVIYQALTGTLWGMAS
jgi:hypothetical protein